MMRLYSTGDVLKLAPGLSPNTFDRWCRDGLARPVRGGTGTGNHRVFDMMTVVGILVAVELRQSERGCVLSYVEKIVDAFAGYGEEELKEGFGEGATHFVTPHAGRPVMEGRPDHIHWPDVQAIYEKVIQHA